MRPRGPTTPAGPRLLAAVGAALPAAATLRLLAPPGRPTPTVLLRRNHRDAAVTLAPGPALVAGLVTAGGLVTAAEHRLAAAAALAATVAGAAGWYDDTVGARPGQRRAKGFAGHLGALREGRVTTGAAKVVGIGGAGVAVGVLLRRPGGGAVADVAVTAVLVAGAANLANLLDLRPGRTLKASLPPALLLAAAPRSGPDGRGAALLAAGVAGASLAVLPVDLRERGMLGDTGANALGAVLGTAAAARLPSGGRLAGAAAVTALSALSERISFSRVIDTTPPLARLDRLGRRTEPGRE